MIEHPAYDEATADYRMALFFQILKRKSTLTFGRRYLVTVEKIREAFIAANPEVFSDCEPYQEDFIFGMYEEALIAECGLRSFEVTK